MYLQCVSTALTAELKQLRSRRTFLKHDCTDVCWTRSTSDSQRHSKRLEIQKGIKNELSASEKSAAKCILGKETADEAMSPKKIVSMKKCFPSAGRSKLLR